MSIDIKLPKGMPLIPLKDTIVFPHAILSVYITEEKSKKQILESFDTNKIIFTSAYENSEEQANKVFKKGCVSLIMRMKEMPNGSLKILIQGLFRATILKFESDFSKVTLEHFSESNKKPSNEDLKSIETIKSLLKDLSYFKESISPDFLLIINSIKSLGQICDLALNSLDLSTKELQKALETFDSNKRFQMTEKILLGELEISQLQGRIQNLIKKEMPKPLFDNYKIANKSQNNPSSSKKEEIVDFLSRMEKKELPEDIKKESLKQIQRLEKMHAESSEASMLRNYLEWILDLPWSESSEDNLDLTNAQNVLDKDHFELIKVKERILEFLAVRKLKPKNLKSPILCFAGPPGVGKTSLGKSIAESMGRSYQRISLGGVKDEAEIRGHRRTYVGAMPGKILQAIKAANTNNPVIVLDELDKLGQDFRGDPSSALLEVLDPEQNHSFKDHYLNLNFDLSNVLFIATVNIVQNIPAALKDRLEIMSISGYTQGEKVEIAERYLIEKSTESNGLPKGHISFSKDSLKYLIKGYTQEAGLRNLTRQISSVCRKIAKNYVLGDKKKISVDKNKVVQFLGHPHFIEEERLKESKVGFATGLAWTSVGGQILHVESIKVKSKKGGLILTGKLGEVMKESAQAALSYIKSYTELTTKSEWFEQNEIHVHLPGGAIPKDGPSAGVTLASSLLSLVTNTPLRHDFAMTGEITLSGRVLPVGGIKEKILAAFNKGIYNIILPIQNEKDLEDIKEEYKEKLNFFLVSHLDEVFSLILDIPSSVKKKQSLKEILKDKNLESVA